MVRIVFSYAAALERKINQIQDVQILGNGVFFKMAVFYTLELVLPRIGNGSLLPFPAN